MGMSLRRSVISRLAGAAAVICMYGAGSAWAGDGGNSGLSLQGVLDDICSVFGTPCPQLPTVTQQVIEIAGLTSEPPNVVRALNSVCGSTSTSGLPCPEVAVNAVNGLAKSSPLGSVDALWYLTPLAFTPGPVATQYGNPAAKSFFYAHVLAGANGQPQTLDLFYDLTGTTTLVVPVALSLPLVVLNPDGSERPVAATLNAVCVGFSCANATVSGDFLGTGKTAKYNAGALGLDLNFAFLPSPNSSFPHPIVEVQIPLVVTMQNDPQYFATPPCPAGVNPISNSCVAFTKDVRGFPTSVLGTGKSVGVAPYAAPPCTTTTCPSTPPTPPATSPSFFGFCATISSNSVIAAFASIGTDGTTYASTPTPGAASTTQCPPQS
ncbi:MAG: hypothetical protein JOZ11_15215 [Alphaproteobacteria bacterium]|nr:hypothetical protein [Alphaproteobacteria bacterium]